MKVLKFLKSVGKDFLKETKGFLSYLLVVMIPFIAVIGASSILAISLHTFILTDLNIVTVFQLIFLIEGILILSVALLILLKLLITESKIYMKKKWNEVK